MPTSKQLPSVRGGAVEHYFVVTAMGTSAHRHGPFESREAAKDWAKKHYANWPCWLLPAEYIGSVAPRPLDKDGLQPDDPRRKEG